MLKRVNTLWAAYYLNLHNYIHLESMGIESDTFVSRLNLLFC